MIAESTYTFGEKIERYLDTERYNILTKLVHKFAKGNSVLIDTGCGNAPYFKFFPQITKIGLDSDGQSNSNTKNMYPEDVFITALGTRLPITDSSIDIVISSEFIEHLPKEWHKKYLEELRRVLREDGIIILTTPNRRRLATRIRDLLHIHLSQSQFHINRAKRFEEIKKRSGRDITEGGVSATTDKLKHHYEYEPSEFENFLCLEKLKVIKRGGITLDWYLLIWLRDKIPLPLKFTLLCIKLTDTLFRFLPFFYKFSYQFFFVIEKIN